MKFNSTLRVIVFIFATALVMGVHSAHAAEYGSGSHFPVLHDSMSEYWQIADNTSQKNNPSEVRKDSFDSATAVAPVRESSVQGSTSVRNPQNEEGSRTVKKERLPTQVPGALPAQNPVHHPDHRCENGKKKDLPRSASPNSDPAT